MKVVIAHRSGAAQVAELPAPELGRGTCLVRVSHSALSLADELGMIAGITKMLKRGQDGVPLGCSVSGIIERCGPGVTKLKTGLRVAGFGQPYVYHATQLVVPENLLVELPKKVSHEEGAFAGLGAIAIHLFRQGRLSAGETALVFGGGLIGNLTAQVARGAGVTSLLVDPGELRLAKARNVGVSDCSKPDRESLVREIDSLTGGAGADAALITGEALPDAVDLALELLRPGGRLVIGFAGRLKLDTRLLLEKEITIIPANSAGPGRYDPRFERDGLDYPGAMVRWTERENMASFCQMLNSRKVQVAPLVTDRIPLERAPLLYEKLQRSADGAALAAVFTV